MATARIAISSLFDTVTETAGAAQHLVKSVSSGAQMFNDYVEDARWKQQARLVTGRIGFEEQLMRERTLEIVRGRQELDKYVEENPQQTALVKEIWEKLEAALKP